MGVGSILVVLALLTLVAFFVATPLVWDQHLGPGMDSERSHWIAEREQALEALLELDFDHQLGKVPEEIYAEQRKLLRRQGAEALKHLERLASEDTKPAGKTKRTRGVKTYSDADLEAMIAKRKKQVD